VTLTNHQHPILTPWVCGGIHPLLYTYSWRGAEARGKLCLHHI
jgi:hypothetical protein